MTGSDPLRTFAGRLGVLVEMGAGDAAGPSSAIIPHRGGVTDGVLRPEQRAIRSLQTRLHIAPPLL